MVDSGIRSFPHQRRCRRGSTLTLLLAALLAGCAADQPTPPAPRTVDLGRGSSDPAEPIMSEATDGLELQWWITSNRNGVVGEILAPYAFQPTGLDEAGMSAWRANGLRMVRVPAERFLEVVERLPVLHTRQREWVGWSASWKEIYRGREVGGQRDLLIDGRRTSVEPGYARLLTRCWPAPSAAGPVCRIELAVQRYEPPVAESESPFARPTIERPEAAGPFFDQLSINGVLDDDYVYIITAERPGVIWELPAPRSATPDSSAESVAAVGSEALPTVGPRTRVIPTVGEMLFSATAEDTRSDPIRVILVLIPRGPEAYRLLP